MKQYIHFGINTTHPITNLVTGITKQEVTYVKAFCKTIPKNFDEVSGDFNAEFSCSKCKEIAGKVTNMIEYLDLKRIVKGDDENGS